MTDFLSNAQSILETATSAGSGDFESGDLSILIGQDGAIHMLASSDWPLASLQAHHGSRAAYRVSRSGDRVRVEGKTRTDSCVLESEPTLAARVILADRPRYLLAA